MKIFKFLILSIILSIFSRCGPSKETCEIYKINYPTLTCEEACIFNQHEICNPLDCNSAAEMREIRRKMSIISIKDTIVDIKIPHYYKASELGLIIGTVYSFRPEDNHIADEYFKQNKKVYIHIITSDNSVKILECSESNWLNLYIGDILE